MATRPRKPSDAPSGPASGLDAPVRLRRLPPDAQRNAERVLLAARRAFAETGLDASYHDIARLADVGVGTVYRRYPDRMKLKEAVLVAILNELSECAEQALARTDIWPAFADFFTTLALRTREHSGLSESLDEHGGQLVADARIRLIGLMRTLSDRAQRHGVFRADLAACRT
jgi:AcrR family transcriptional regulator